LLNGPKGKCEKWKKCHHVGCGADQLEKNGLRVIQERKIQDKLRGSFRFRRKTGEEIVGRVKRQTIGMRELKHNDRKKIETKSVCGDKPYLCP